MLRHSKIVNLCVAVLFAAYLSILVPDRYAPRISCSVFCSRRPALFRRTQRLGRSMSSPEDGCDVFSSLLNDAFDFANNWVFDTFIAQCVAQVSSMINDRVSHF